MDSPKTELEKLRARKVEAQREVRNLRALISLRSTQLQADTRIERNAAKAQDAIETARLYSAPGAPIRPKQPARRRPVGESAPSIAAPGSSAVKQTCGQQAAPTPFSAETIPGGGLGQTTQALAPVAPAGLGAAGPSSSSSSSSDVATASSSIFGGQQVPLWDPNHHAQLLQYLSSVAQNTASAAANPFAFPSLHTGFGGGTGIGVSNIFTHLPPVCTSIPSPIDAGPTRRLKQALQASGTAAHPICLDEELALAQSVEDLSEEDSLEALFAQSDAEIVAAIQAEEPVYDESSATWKPRKAVKPKNNARKGRKSDKTPIGTSSRCGNVVTVDEEGYTLGETLLPPESDVPEVPTAESVPVEEVATAAVEEEAAPPKKRAKKEKLVLHEEDDLLADL
eukprot:g14374.t1